MGKLWWRCAGWSNAGRLMRNVKFKSRVKSERAKQKRNRNFVWQGNADVRGRQRTFSIRCLVIVGIVFVRAV